jgi:hypothetical protein
VLGSAAPMAAVGGCCPPVVPAAPPLCTHACVAATFDQRMEVGRAREGCHAQWIVPEIVLRWPNDYRGATLSGD